MTEVGKKTNQNNLNDRQLKQANNNAQRVTQAVVAIHQAKGFTVQVSLVPPKTYFCVFQFMNFELLSFMVQIASLQKPFLYF